MTIVEFKRMLDLAGMPVAYSYFKGTQDDPVPPPPYICYLVDDSENLMADNKVYHKIIDVNIELYTTKKDLAAEAALEKVLDDHEIPYDTFETFIDSEDLFQKIYEVRLM